MQLSWADEAWCITPLGPPPHPSSGSNSVCCSCLWEVKEREGFWPRFYNQPLNEEVCLAFASQEPSPATQSKPCRKGTAAKLHLGLNFEAPLHSTSQPGTIYKALCLEPACTSCYKPF